MATNVFNVTINFTDTEFTKTRNESPLFARLLSDKFIQFVLLAAAQNKGSIKLSKLLFFVNRINLADTELDAKRMKLLTQFGAYDDKKKVFNLNMAKYEKVKDLILYENPIQTDLSNYKIGWFIIKVLAISLGLLFWKDKTIIIIFIYLVIKLYKALSSN